MSNNILNRSLRTFINNLSSLIRLSKPYERTDDKKYISKNVTQSALKTYIKTEKIAQNIISQGINFSEETMLETYNISE